MATYHLTAKIGERGKAKAHAEYIARDGKYSGSTRYEDLEATRYGNMPTWAKHNPAEFWQAADDNERANGSAYREIEIALPRELTPSQRLELVQDFVSQEIGDKHAYQFAIHTPKAALEKGEQPHAHIMYSERMRDGIERDPEQYFKRYNAKNPEKGGAKKHSGGKRADELKNELIATRERWANIQNKHLEKHGHSERVTHLSLEAQGITDREPEKHLGGSGVRDNAKKSALVELRAAIVENTKAKAEVAPIVELIETELKQQQQAKREAQERQAAMPLDYQRTLQRTLEAFKKNIEADGNLSQVQKEKVIAMTQRALENGDFIEKREPIVKSQDQQEQRALLTLANIEKQQRERWRQAEHDKLKEEANRHRERHKELSAKEPKAFFKTAKFVREHDDWVNGTNRIRQEIIDALEAAKVTLAGNSEKERALKSQFEQAARETLKTQHPELNQVLMDKSAREQAEWEEKRRIEREQEKQARQLKSKSNDYDLEL